jgi:hypothetical protein
MVSACVAPGAVEAYVNRSGRVRNSTCCSVPAIHDSRRLAPTSCSSIGVRSLDRDAALLTVVMIVLALLL